MTYAAAAKALRSATTVVVTTHLNPDGDGLGTGLALVRCLTALGKRVRFCCPGKPASIYGFLPGFARITAVMDEAQARKLPAPDAIVSCDAGDLARLGPVSALVAKTRTKGGVLVNLDHHSTNDRFGDVNLVDVDAASSGVVAWNLLKKLGVKLDKPTAACLYVTVVFDTGRFMHSNTTAACLRFAATLVDTGIDAAALNRALTYTRTPHDLKVMQLGLEHLTVDAEAPALAGIALPAAAIAAVGEPEDWGDLVEFPRSLTGNQIAYLMRERPDCSAVRISLRSNPPYAVAPVAEAFGGGGHQQAAGCTFPGNLEAAIKDVLPRLRRALAP